MLKTEKQGDSDEQTRKRTLRLRPGVVIVILQWLVWFVVPMLIPGSAVILLVRNTREMAAFRISLVI